jgi:hypothetical protein
VANRARQLRAVEVDTLVARYEEVGSVNAIAHEYQVTRQTVAKLLAERGIETIRRMSATDVAIATDRYTLGDSAATIGRRLGFAPHTVLSALRAAGVPIRPRPGR